MVLDLYRGEEGREKEGGRRREGEGGREGQRWIDSVDRDFQKKDSASLLYMTNYTQTLGDTKYM